MINEEEIFDANACRRWIALMPPRGVNKRVLESLLDILIKQNEIPSSQKSLKALAASSELLNYASLPRNLDKVVSDFREAVECFSGYKWTLKGGQKKTGVWKLHPLMNARSQELQNSDASTIAPVVRNVEQFLLHRAAGEKSFSNLTAVVIGDLAFDHSYRCKASQPGFGARHSNEEMFDIEPDGDDGGTVGGVCNTMMFLRALGVAVSLLTCVGSDLEGKRSDIEATLFANYAGALQCMKVTGEKVGLEDFLDPSNITYFRQSAREPVLLSH